MSRTDRDPEERIVHVEFDTSRDDPTTAVIETLAELEGREPTELPAIYDTIDHVIDHLYAEPPTPDAQVEVSFSYEDYRITVHQDGKAEFRKVAE